MLIYPEQKVITHRRIDDQCYHDCIEFLSGLTEHMGEYVLYQCDGDRFITHQCQQCGYTYREYWYPADEVTP